jgi:multidrug efflux system outer membrane protein
MVVLKENDHKIQVASKMNSHPKAFRRWLELAMTLLLLTGCAVGPDFTEPVVKTPTAYRTPVMPGEAISDLKWWELFDDPMLFSLVTTALENNRDVQIAISRIEQARATVGFTRADQFPSVDVDAGARGGNVNGGARAPDTQSTYYLAAPLNWEIDFWGKFKRSTEAARAQLLASEFGLKAVQLALISDVVTTYYQLLDFRQRLTISQSTLQSRLESLNIIQQRFDKGIIAELDVNQAQIQKEIAAAAIPQFQRSIGKTENGLSVLLGRLPDAYKTRRTLQDQPNLPDIPVGLPADILERRPDIAQAKFLLKAQTEAIGVAEALRLPAISLTGTLGVASTDLGSITTEGGVWSVGGQLLGPVIDFGKNKRRVEIETQKARQALFQYENTVLTAFREVEDALAEIATYRSELAAIERQQKAAQNANMLSKERYDKGVSSYLEVLDTERTLFNAELRLSELQQLYRNAYVNLYKALGGGWTTKTEREAVTPAQRPLKYTTQIISPPEGTAR